MRKPLLAVSLFALAACGGEAASDAPAGSEGASKEAAQTSEGEGGATETATDAATEETSANGEDPKPGFEQQGAEPEMADQKTPPGTIPVVYHGVWDATTGSCSDASDGRLTIGAKEVSFYESVGTVTAVEKEGDDIKVTAAMEGEGEKWNEQYIFVLEDGKLNTQVVGSNSGFERKRCS